MHEGFELDKISITLYIVCGRLRYPRYGRLDMKTRNLISMGFIFLFVFLVASVPALADTIRLKNGTVIKGKVVGFAGGSFTIVLELGSTSKSRAKIDVVDVETIEFDGRADEGEASATQNVPRPSRPDDDSGHRSDAAPPVTPTRPASSSPTSSSPGPTTSPVASTSRPSPTIAKEVVVSVQAKDDWTYASMIVRRGDRIQVSATGKVKLSATRESGPEGINVDDKDKLLLERPTGSLIAVIGEDNDDFIYIGREGEFVAQRDGKLFLSVNEGDLADNEGSFSVRVKIDPSK